MKWLVVLLTLCLLQQQSVQGTFLDNELEYDIPDIEDIGGTKVNEDADKSSNGKKSEIEKDQKDIQALSPTRHENNLNKSPSYARNSSSEEDINKGSSTFTELAFNGTFHKNGTGNKKHQARLGLASTISETKGLNFGTAREEQAEGLGNGLDLGTAREEQAEGLGNGLDLGTAREEQEGLGNGLDLGTAREEQAEGLGNGLDLGTAREDQAGGLGNGLYLGTAREDQAGGLGNGLDLGTAREDQAEGLGNGLYLGTAREGQAERLSNGLNLGTAREDQAEGLSNGINLGTAREDQAEELSNGLNLGTAREDQAEGLSNGIDLGTAREDQAEGLGNGLNLGSAREDQAEGLSNGLNLGTPKVDQAVGLGNGLNLQKSTTIRPQLTIDSSSNSTVNYWPSALGTINTKTFPEGANKDNQQKSRKYLTGGSQVGLVSNQNRPYTITDLSNNSTVNNWASAQGTINTGLLPDSPIQGYQQQRRQHLGGGSQVGLVSNQNWPSTTIDSSINLSDNNWPSAQGNVSQRKQEKHLQALTTDSNGLHTKILKPVTEIAQLMKVIRVVSNVSSANVAISQSRSEGKDNINGEYLQQNQRATINKQNNNMISANNRKPLDALTKIVQLLKVVEVVSNSTNIVMNEESNTSYQSLPTATINAGTQRTVDNPLTLQGNYKVIDSEDITKHNVPYIRQPMAIGGQNGYNSNQYKLNSDSTPTTQGGKNINEPSYNQYYQQQKRPSEATQGQSGFGNYQSWPNIGLSAATTLDSIPNLQGGTYMNNPGFNLNQKQQYTPSEATVGQSGFGNYQSSANVGLNAATTLDITPTKQVQTFMNNPALNQEQKQQYTPSEASRGQSGFGNYQSFPNVELNAATALDITPAKQGETYINNPGFNQDQKQKYTPSEATGGQSGLGNHQSMPNVGLNAATTLDVTPTKQVETFMNNPALNQDQKQQFTPSEATGGQSGFGIYQSLPKVELNASTALDITPTKQVETFMNNPALNQDQKQQYTPSEATGGQSGFGNYQFFPNVGLNAATLDNTPTMQGGTYMNNPGFNQDQQKQYTPSEATGGVSGFGNHQSMPNVGLNAATTLDSTPTMQGGTYMNNPGFNQDQKQQYTPSKETGFGNYQSFPNVGLNTATTSDNTPKMQGGTYINNPSFNQYQKQQNTPSEATGGQSGFGNYQSFPNVGLNAATTLDNTPTMQGGTYMNNPGFNQDQQKQYTPSKATGGVSGFGNHQSMPNVGLNAATALDSTLTMKGGTIMSNPDFNQDQNQQNTPSEVIGGGSGFGNHQSMPNVGLNEATTLDSIPTMQGGTYMNNPGFNQDQKQQYTPSVETGFGNYHSLSNVGLNAITTLGSTPTMNGGTNMNDQGFNQYYHQHNTPSEVIGGQSGFGNYQSMSNEELNAATVGSTPTMQGGTSMNDLPGVVSVLSSLYDNIISARELDNSSENLDQTSAQSSQARVNEENLNPAIANQDISLQTETSNTVSKGNQQASNEKIEMEDHLRVNLNQQMFKPSIAAETEAERVLNNQQMPIENYNPSAGAAIHNMVIPTQNTYATGSQNLPPSTIWNNPSLISEYQLNKNNYNSKLIQESSQNHVTEIIRNQLLHSQPAIQGQIMPNAPATPHAPSKYSQLDNSIDANNRNRTISSEKENNISPSLNYNHKIAENTLSTGLNVGGGGSYNRAEKEETSRSILSDAGNSSTVTESKAHGSSETRSKAASEESSLSKKQTTNFKEQKTTQELQNKENHTPKVETTPITKNSIPPVKTGTTSVELHHVDCIKKEPLSNGSISFTTIGNCMMHEEQEHASAVGSLAVNAPAATKTDINNIATAKSDASFNSTVANTNDGKSHLVTSSGSVTAEASNKLQSQTATD
nr:uncharacterized protein LOC106679012 [Halyomorpha halys]